MSALALTRRRTSVWGAVAVLAALATALAVYSYLSWLRAQVPVSGRLVAMVVAAQDLEPGTVLDASMVTVTQHPSRYLPAGAITDAKKVFGQAVAVTIFEGEPITARKIGKKGGFSSIVPAGTRAYSLAINSGSGLGFLPKSGDRVDVIATFPREVLGEPTSITILRGKEVASVSLGGRESGKVAKQLGVETASQSAFSITLFVTPTEAERLAMAESLGRITLVLAPVGADTDPAPAPVRPGDLGSK